MPIGNFVGWWLAPFFIVLIFYLVFQKKNLINDRLVNAAPLADILLHVSSRSSSWCFR